MRSFLLVTINPKGKTVPEAKLNKRFDKALDWISYAPNCWLLYTTKDPSTWYERIKEEVGEGPQILVIEVNIESRAGWLPRSVWDWIRKDRES